MQVEIKWYFPDPRLVKMENRIPMAIKAFIDFNYNGMPSGHYNYHLLLWERSERDELQRKFDKLQNRFIEQSKELSSFKKKQNG